MKLILVVIFLIVGTVCGRTIPINPSDISVELLNDGNSKPLVRKARQFGYGGYGGFGGFGPNNFDFNPYNDTPNNYDGNPFNDSPHRQLYNNFDFNPFNNSPNNYDLNPFNNSNFFGKKKK